MNEEDACSNLGIEDARALCDEGLYCERHYQEQLAEHAWMRGVPLSAVTGVLGPEERQALTEAGRGHLLPPED
jgi:hypothetical protein